MKLLTQILRFSVLFIFWADSLSAQSTQAIDTISVETTIKEVTVFFQGSEVTREGKINLKKGKTLLRLDNLSAEISANSIQVEGMEDCTILSVKHHLVMPGDALKNDSVMAMNKTIRKKKEEIYRLNEKIKVYELEEKLLLDNSKLGSKDVGTTTNEIISAANFYRERLNEIRNECITLKLELNRINKELMEFMQLYNTLYSSLSKERSHIEIIVECKSETEANLKVSYFCPSAGWQPNYDFRVQEINDPLKIVYNANVFQSTGEDWDNVEIKLSSTNPTISGEKPELFRWVLGSPPPVTTNKATGGFGSISGVVRDANTGESLPTASVVIMNGNEFVNGISTDMNGQFTIKPISSGYYSITASFMGYKSEVYKNIYLGPSEHKNYTFNLSEESLSLMEVNVIEYTVPLINGDYSGATYSMNQRSVESISSTTAGVVRGDNIRGSRTGGESEVYIDGIKVRSSSSYQGSSKQETLNYISNSLTSNVTNIEYKIEIPYSIPSNGQDYAIKIKETNIPVRYVHFAVPKLDLEVFLIAEITDWAKLNLLPGVVNIYYQGTYTGESYLNSLETSDTLKVSLGRDKNIVLNREGIVELSDKKTSGNYTRQTSAWNITVRNNKSSEIFIVIEDQLPISNRKSITVEPIELSNAEVNSTDGKLSWSFTLKPDEKKVIPLVFSVKYPKNVTVFVD